MSDIVENEDLCFAEGFVRDVNLDLADIKRSFFRIGFHLHEANQLLYFKKLGFENISDCAESLFGFKKTTTYDLMQIYRKFHDKKAPMKIDARFEKYSRSQLIALLNVKVGLFDFTSMMQPNDSVDVIKRAVKIWNNKNTGIYYSGLGLSKDIRSLDDFITAENRKLVSEIKCVVDNFEDISEDSVYPEKQDNEEKTEDSVYPEKQETVENVPCEDENEDVSLPVLECSNFIEIISKCFEEFLLTSDYRVSFKDSKGMYLKVFPDHFSEVLAHVISRAVIEDSEEIRKWIKKNVNDNLLKYSYEVNLHGRKQNVSVFSGNIAKFVCGGISEEYLIKFPPSEKKRKKK